MHSILSVISQHPFFKNIGEYELKSFLRDAKTKKISGDKALIVQGFSADVIYLIVKGSFFLRAVENGEEILIDTRKAGEFLCENAIENELMCPYTAIALEDSKIIAFSGAVFRNILKKFPRIARKFSYISQQAQTQISLLKETLAFYESKYEKASLSIFSIDPTNPFLLSKLNHAIGGEKQLEYCRTIAFYSREIARFLCPFMEGVLYWSAFLHEIGKLTLNNFELAQFKERTARLTFKSDTLTPVYTRTLEVLAPDKLLCEQMWFIPYLTENDWKKMPVPAQILKAAKDFTDLNSCLVREGAIAVMRSREGRYNPLILDVLELFFDKTNNLRVNSGLANLRILNQALCLKFPCNEEHCRRVAYLSAHLASLVGLKQEEIEDIRIAAELHNIGMIELSHDLLNSRRRLTRLEFEKVKQHPLYLDGFVSKNVPALEKIGYFSKYHHENFDGSGYPFGVAGKHIPLQARILRICDVYTALSSHRNYRHDLDGNSLVYSSPHTLEIMTDMQPSIFDPELFRLFVDNVESWSLV